MGLERLKFWHWMVIGVLIGVGYGWVRTQLRDASEPEVRTWDRRQFNDALNQGAVVRNLVLHPMVDGQEWLTGEIYQRENGSFTVEIRRRPQQRRWWQGLGTTRPATAPAATVATVKPELPKGQWVELMMLAAEPDRKAKEYKAEPTGREYLAELQKRFPVTPDSHRDLNFRYAWWEEPRTTMAIYGAGGFVVIGVVWPTLIALLMGAGLVKRAEEDAYDLSRFKGGPESKPEAKPTVTQADRDELAELNARLEAGVADMIQGSTAPEIDHDAEHAAAVKKLEARPLDAAEVAAANQPEEAKEYAGEFYPVVKPHGHKSDKG